MVKIGTTVTTITLRLKGVSVFTGLLYTQAAKYYLPMHVLQLPVYPVLLVQMKLPSPTTTSEQVAFS